MRNIDSRMTTMEVALASIGASRCEKIGDKQKFWKEVLESQAISNITKLSTPSEYRIWNRKMRNAWQEVRLHARRTLQWRDTVKEKGIADELELGHANMSAMEAIIEHLNIETANDMKGGGVKFEGMVENMMKLNRELWSILLDK